MPPRTPLLDRVKIPSDMRHLSGDQLKQLADELRAETIDTVSVTGGHLGSSLGVVELTVAIHAVFENPRDRPIWDGGPPPTAPPRKKSPQAGATPPAPCATRSPSPAPPAGRRANTTRSARPIPAP